MRHLLIFLGMLMAPVAASAAYGERWYNVEVIIFSYASDAGVQEEHWPIETGTPDISNSVSLVRRDNSLETLPGQIIEFEALPFQMLSGALGRLNRSSRYDVLYSRAWRLPDLPSHSATPVRILAGKRYTTDGRLAPPAIASASQFTSMADDALFEIDGRIKISLSKFLDVDADLLYRRNVILPDAEGLPVNEFRQFRLTEYRRMKSKTIHYLDHPMFGVIIGIDRYQPDSGEDEEVIRPKSASEINQ